MTTPLAGTDAYAQVRGFSNAGFEANTPPPTAGAYAIKDALQVPSWSTTEPPVHGCPNGCIELWGTGFNGVNSYEGSVHAELNAYEAASLFQDLCLVSGETLGWSFAHRGRSGTDTMRLTVGSDVVTTASTGAAWQVYSGNYVYTGATGIVTFFFEATTGISTGNFIDAVEIDLDPIVEFLAPTGSGTEGAPATPPLLSVNGTVTVASTVTVSVTGGTATGGSDYSLTTTVPIPAGVYDGTAGTAIALPLTLANDLTLEGDETIQIGLTGVTGDVAISDANCSGVSQTTHVYTISDPPLCGDSNQDVGEQCDDGNTASGDGCSATCQVESGYSCTSAFATNVSANSLADCVGGPSPSDPSGVLAPIALPAGNYQASWLSGCLAHNPTYWSPEITIWTNGPGTETGIFAGPVATTEAACLGSPNTAVTPFTIPSGATTYVGLLDNAGGSYCGDNVSGTANFRLSSPSVCAPLCGNSSLDPGETCDGTADAACPGLCIASGSPGECTCGAATGSFVCDGTAYLSQNNPTQLSSFDTSATPFAFTPIGSTDHGYNAMGFNPVDGFLYAMDLTNDHLLQIDNTGAQVDLGIVAGLPPSNYNAGGFAPDGKYYVQKVAGGDIYQIDLGTQSATPVGLASGPPNLPDVAVNPVDGLVYGVADGTSTVYVVNATAATVTTKTIAGLPAGPYGAQWFDGLGRMFFSHNSTGNVYRMDDATVAAPTATFVSAGPPSGINDGASCGAAPTISKSVSPSSAAPGDTVTYTFEIGNGLGGQLAVDFVDDLSSVDDFVGTALDESLTPINGTFQTATVVVSGGTGTPVFSNSNKTMTITGMLIPASSKATVTVDVVIPPGLAPGSYFNQAVGSNLTETSIPRLSQRAATLPTTVLSDDPNAPQIPYPTVIVVAPAAATCTDGIQNGDETDIDCGGASCPACEDGSLCLGDADCTSGDCTEGICAVATTCGDGVIDAPDEQCDVGPGVEVCDSPDDLDGDGLVGCEDVTDCCANNGVTCSLSCQLGPLCRPIQRDPQVIKFREGKPDFLKLHGRVEVSDAYDANAQPFTFLLSNAKGTIYRSDVDGADLIPKTNRRWRYKNPLARSSQGVSKLVTRLRNDKGTTYYTVKVKTYGDFSAATIADMTTQIFGVEGVGVVEAKWRKRPKGWILYNRDIVPKALFCEPTECNDDLLNQDETDIDCGGTLCQGCGEGESCLDDSDCISNNCDAGFCAQQLCGNGTIEGGEACELDADCQVNESCESCQCVGTGDVRITLEWDGIGHNADLDLHVIDPSGEEIDYANTMSASGGELDSDNICSPVGPRVENVFWLPATAPLGTYTVYVDYFGHCDGAPQPPVDFTVTTEVDSVVTVYPVVGQAFTGCGGGGCGAGSCCAFITSFVR